MVAVSYRCQDGRQVLTLPLKLESRANFRGHTRSRSHVKSIREQRGMTRIVLQSQAKKVQLPIRIKLTRIAPRTLDPNENLPMSFKSVVDGIADWLEVDDRSGLLCEYGQEKADTPNTYGCRIEIG
jgi:hypothetical protein